MSSKLKGVLHISSWCGLTIEISGGREAADPHLPQRPIQGGATSGPMDGGDPQARARHPGSRKLPVAEMRGDDQDTAARAGPTGRLEMLEAAVDRFGLSARAYQRVRRIARTIADLAGAEDIAPPHMAEALSMRVLDKRRRRRRG